jgi:phosphatidylglycerophosphate synthase
VARDFVYVIIFATLPLVAWHGLLVAVLVALLLTEIIVTMGDFIVEEWVRRSLGGVFPGERVTHAVMGIVYGAMLGYLVPVLRDWWREPTGFVAARADNPAMVVLLLSMAAGILVSGVRDLYALLELPRGGWPWRVASR